MNWLKIELTREVLRFYLTFSELMTMQMLNKREKSTFYLAGEAG